MTDDQGSKEDPGEHVESRDQRTAFSLLSISEGEGQGACVMLCRAWTWLGLAL